MTATLPLQRLMKITLAYMGESIYDSLNIKKCADSLAVELVCFACPEVLEGSNPKTNKSSKSHTKMLYNLTMTDTTDFGYQDIPTHEKTAKVAEVFHSVASRYDIMNDLMSLGIHRLWKRFAMAKANVRPGQTVLDIAGGTGDLAYRFSQSVGEQGKVFLADINASMLQVGRKKLLDRGVFSNLDFVQANAECLPFAPNTFDCVTIAFGLRNVTHKSLALASMYQALKPGGKLIILEFSKPMLPLLQPVYDVYSFSVLPWLGEMIANDAESYRYLAESIRRHPDQETLKQLVLDAGFDKCEYYNLTGGIVALHLGTKY